MVKTKYKKLKDVFATTEKIKSLKIIMNGVVCLGKRKMYK